VHNSKFKPNLLSSLIQFTQKFARNSRKLNLVTIKKREEGKEEIQLNM